MGAGDGFEDVSVVHAPVSLFPTPFPQKAFQRAQFLMPGLSELVHAVSEDMDYVNETLSTAAQFDSFTKSLMDVHSKTAEARAKNGSPISLGLHRSDYMLDEPSGQLLQVLSLVPLAFCSSQCTLNSSQRVTQTSPSHLQFVCSTTAVLSRGFLMPTEACYLVH